MEIFRGENMTLTYSYGSPRFTESPGNFYFSRHTPGSTHEEMLTEGSVDPKTGHIDITYKPLGNILVTSYLEGFSIRMTDLDTLSDTAHYLTDVKFEREATLQDTVVMNVYNLPTFVEKPPVEIIHAENDTAHMTWTLNDLPSKPEIQSITLRHVRGDANYTLVTQNLVPETGQWQITYPDAQLRLKGRISYTPGPLLEYISFSVWNLNPDDSGKYILHVAYTNDVKELHHVTRLHVTTGHNWVSSPADLSYVILSRELVLNFTADNNLYDLKYELCPDDEEPIASLVVRETRTELNTKATWHPSRTVIFNRTTSSVLICIPHPEFQDGGNYTMKLRDSSGLVLMQHRFRLVVINESTLTPSIKQTNSPGNFSDMMWFHVKITANVPVPDIVVYMKDPENSTELHTGGLIYAGANKTNAMTTSVPRGHGFVVVVVFNYPGLVYTSTTTREMAGDQGNEQQHTSHNRSILVTTHNEEICSKNINTQLLISVQVCVLVLTLVVFATACRVFDWKRYKKCHHDEQPQLLNYKSPYQHMPSPTIANDDVKDRGTDSDGDNPVSQQTSPCEGFDSDYRSGGSSPSNTITIEISEDDGRGLEPESDIMLNIPSSMTQSPETRTEIFPESCSLLTKDEMKNFHDLSACQTHVLSSSPPLPPF